MSSNPTVGCHSGPRLTRADIPDYLRVDDEGRVWTRRNRGGYSTTTERRAERRTAQGYYNVEFPKSNGRRNPQPAHRIVFAWFNDEVPAGTLVRHMNGNRTDNRPANLRIGRNRDNMADARERKAFTGDHARGSRNYRTHLTENDVRAMRLAYDDGDTMPSLGQRYGVSVGAVHSIIRRKTWRHVD